MLLDMWIYWGSTVQVIIIVSRTYSHNIYSKAFFLAIAYIIDATLEVRFCKHFVPMGAYRHRVDFIYRFVLFLQSKF